MKKKLFAILLSALLVTVSFPTMSFAADPSGAQTGGSVTGDSNVSTVALNVIVPTSLPFSLDPLELDSTNGSQVKDVTYFIANKTLAPVKVSFNLTATLTADVALVADKSQLKKDDLSSDVPKDIYFGFLGANSISEGTTFTDVVAGSTATFVDTDKDTLVPFSASSARGADDGAGTISFALASAKATVPGTADAMADNGKGSAAFQFYGELNTYANWQASDIQVTGAFTLIPLRSSTYSDTLTAADYCSDGVNQLKNTDAVDATIAGSTGNANVSYTAGTPVKIKFGVAINTAEVWVAIGSSSSNAIGGAATYDSSKDILSIDTAGLSETVTVNIYTNNNFNAVAYALTLTPAL
jgi:hypothetical protein